MCGQQILAIAPQCLRGGSPQITRQFPGSLEPARRGVLLHVCARGDSRLVTLLWSPSQVWLSSLSAGSSLCTCIAPGESPGGQAAGSPWGSGAPTLFPSTSDPAKLRLHRMEEMLRGSREMSGLGIRFLYSCSSFIKFYGEILFLRKLEERTNTESMFCRYNTCIT